MNADALIILAVKLAANVLDTLTLSFSGELKSPRDCPLVKHHSGSRVASFSVLFARLLAIALITHLVSPRSTKRRIASAREGIGFCFDRHSSRWSSQPFVARISNRIPRGSMSAMVLRNIH